jgi:hypothetical protein
LNHHPLPTTPYYERSKINHPEVKEEWVRFILANPTYTEIQDDGRLRLWGFIEEAGTWVRVILESGKVHNAFLDRNALRRWGIP